MRSCGVLLSCALALSLNGCDKLTGSSSATCGSDDAKNVTLQLVRDEIIRIAGKQNEDNQTSLLKSKIRAAAQQLQLALEDVRTSKNDPNSTKKFCTASLKVTVPSQFLADAEEARRDADLGSVTQMADTADVDMEANTFKKDFDFNIQPTDDGQKIYSEIENASSLLSFFAEMVQDNLLKSAVADAKAQKDRLAAEQQAAESQANSEMEQASLEEANSNQQSSEQAINATWQALLPEVRAQLLPMQRAWIKKKDATCKLEAAQNATSENAMSVAYAACEARENNGRTEFLQQQGRSAVDTSDE